MQIQGGLDSKVSVCIDILIETYGAGLEEDSRLA